jgi:hypothetical protein
VILGREYNIQPAYTFIAPLALNRGSYVVYNDSIDDWRSDLEDVSIQGKAEVKLTVGEVINQVPLDLTLKVTPKFIEGTPASLKSKVITQVDKTIKARATTNDVNITLSVDGKEAFDHLDGIRFEAIASQSLDNSQVEALKKTGQTLKLNKIGGIITGTVIIEDKDD